MIVSVFIPHYTKLPFIVQQSTRPNILLAADVRVVHFIYSYARRSLVWLQCLLSSFGSRGDALIPLWLITDANCLLNMSVAMCICILIVIHFCSCRRSRFVPLSFYTSWNPLLLIWGAIDCRITCLYALTHDDVSLKEGKIYLTRAVIAWDKACFWTVCMHESVFNL